MASEGLLLVEDCMPEMTGGSHTLEAPVPSLEPAELQVVRWVWSAWIEAVVEQSSLTRHLRRPRLHRLLENSPWEGQVVEAVELLGACRKTDDSAWEVDSVVEEAELLEVAPMVLALARDPTTVSPNGDTRTRRLSEPLPCQDRAHAMLVHLCVRRQGRCRCHSLPHTL